ncbi:MAG: hypothetical protein IJI90_07060 [Carnobacterium sp.]|uniref:hypothetical protein n=1 Tax=Carnobacterium sp. TaxID=48221 RepID=UPI00257BA6D3|nr:hypothetical protein [Carnobacterium sp.]MBQ6484749.1 hypothetical protein [Carnobacterium sp.]
MKKNHISKPIKILMIAIPYILIALYGLFTFGKYILNKSHEDTVVPVLVDRGNHFEMHYDNSGLHKNFLWVNGYPLVRTSLDEDDKKNELIKGYVTSFSPNNEPLISLISYVINDDAIVYQTSDMDRFKVLGYMRLNDVQLNCRNLLEDMGNVISRKYPIHATSTNKTISEMNNKFGIYEGLGYRIEALSNGDEIEWQFYKKVYDGNHYVRDNKIFSMRW